MEIQQHDGVVVEVAGNLGRASPSSARGRGVAGEREAPGTRVHSPPSPLFI